MDNNDTSQVPPVFTSASDQPTGSDVALYSTPGDQPASITESLVGDQSSSVPQSASFVADGLSTYDYSSDLATPTPTDNTVIEPDYTATAPPDANQDNYASSQPVADQYSNPASTSNQEALNTSASLGDQSASIGNSYQYNDNSRNQHEDDTYKDANAIASAISSGGNILITVNSNPTIDELSAAIGLSLALDKAGKKVTAVYGGKTPHAIAFLDPESTFQDDVSSLRDFIISLDKSKADKLKYKVDNESGTVKIFITPYKASITSDDLDFSAGDYNVDTIIALGVRSRDDFDNSILSHGRVLHDAQIITINSGEDVSVLGSINYDDSQASSISEIITSIVDTIGVGLFDQRVATALMTGIVASTDRFSNSKTTPKVMQVASRLMSAGADQQLISSSVSGVVISNQDPSNSTTIAKPIENEVIVQHSSAETIKKTGEPIKDPGLDLGAEAVPELIKIEEDLALPENNNPERLSDARAQVMFAEEDRSSLEPKKAVGLDGLIDIERGPISTGLHEDTIDSSAQEKQSHKNENVKPYDDKSTTPVVPETSSSESSAPDVDMDLPPLPPMPPSIDDLNPGLPPMGNFKPDFMDDLTGLSPLTESADAFTAKKQDEEAKQANIDAKFNSIYGEDLNKLNK